MAEKTNIWDGSLYDGKYINGTSLSTEAGTIYVVIPLVEGHEYLVEVFVSADRYRWTTFASNPKDTSNNGIRSIYSNDSATAGTQFSFTANAGENYLMGYVGHSSAGANSVTIGVFDMSVPDYDSKYLIRSGSTLYIVTDGTLTALDTTDPTAEIVQTYGMDDLPDGSLLVGLTDPEVLYWHDSTDDLPVLTAAVTGVPPTPQAVVTDVQDMSDPSILGIESAAVTASEDVLFALSFDDGGTWKAYNGSQWVTLDTENAGMTAETFQNISLEAWAEVVTGTTYRLRFVLMSTESYVTSAVINYIN